MEHDSGAAAVQIHAGDVVKLWIKISSENRRLGAWFYSLEDARENARTWERLLPVEFPDWPEVTGEQHHGNGDLADLTFPDLIDASYRKGMRELLPALEYVAANHHEGGESELERIVLAAIAKAFCQ